MNGSLNAPAMASPTNSSGDNLSGKLIIKAQLGDDIRKIMIHNEDLTLNELVLMMERIYAGKISNSDEITIKYMDDDGDKITLLNDSDLTVALNFHKVLRLFVLVNGNEQLPTSNTTDNANKEGSLIDAKTFRSELQQIRNSVQAILDRLQIPSGQETTSNQEKEATTAAKAPTPLLVSGATREFDPYKHLQTQRSSTPDSVRSKSSTSNKVINREQKTFMPSSPTSTVDNQQHYQPPESPDANRAPPNAFQQQQHQQQQHQQHQQHQQQQHQQQQQMPTPHFIPTGYNDQQNRAPPTSFNTPPPSSFNAPPQGSFNAPPQAAFNAPPQSSFNAPPPSSGLPGMPPLPNSAVPRFPTSFPNTALPNANPSSAFTPGSAPPPAANVQTSTFIGQQQQQQQQPQSSAAAAPPQGGFYGQQQASGLPKSYMPNMVPNMNTPNSFAQSQPPPSSSNSAPATINPSYVQPTGMPTPPPLASQQPYVGFAPPNSYYNPGQQYPKTS